MGQVIEAGEQGLLRVPVNMLGTIQPHGRYIVEVVGKKLVVEPEPIEELWRLASGESDLGSLGTRAHGLQSYLGL